MERIYVMLQLQQSISSLLSFLFVYLATFANEERVKLKLTFGTFVWTF